jgi:hypothetical protein
LKKEAWKKFIKTCREEDSLEYNLKGKRAKRKVNKTKTEAWESSGKEMDG